MTINDWIQIGVYLGVLLVLVKPLGLYMAKIFEGEWPGSRVSSLVERPLYRRFRQFHFRSLDDPGNRALRPLHDPGQPFRDESKGGFSHHDGFLRVFNAGRRRALY